TAPFINDTFTQALSDQVHPPGAVTEAANHVASGGLTVICVLPWPESTRPAGDQEMEDPASMPLRLTRAVSSAQICRSGEMAAWAREVVTVNCPVATQPPPL